MSNLKNKRFISLIIFINFITLLLLLYEGNIDDYAPKHVGIAYNLINGNIDIIEYQLTLAGAFYSLIGTIILLTNLDINLIPIYPIAIIPYSVILISLIYRLSGKNVLISLLLWMIFVSSPITGSHNAYIWMHGIGDILLFTFYLLMAILYKKTISPNTKYLLFITITVSVSIVYMSYNASYRLLLFLLFFLLLNIILKTNKLDGNFNHILITNLILFLVVLFGLSDFFYDVFLPSNIIDSNVNFAQVIQKFIITIFGIGLTSDSNPLLQYAFGYPDLIMYFWLIKYIIYVSIIFTAIFLIYKNRNKCTIIDFNVVLFTTLSCVSIVYFISRFFVGQFPITEIFRVFWISVIIVYSMIKAKHIKNIITVLLLILLIVNINNIIIANQYELTNDGKFEHIVSSAEWIYKSNENRAFVPDVLTYGYYYNVFTTNTNNIEPVILKFEEVEKIYTGSEIDKKYTIIINYQATHNNVQNWNNLIPFKDIKNTIENNPSLKMKIYDNHNISIYRTSKH